MVGGEVVEVIDEDFLGEGEEGEEGLELFVRFGRFDGGVSAVEPVDEELKGGGVVFGEVELFGLGFGEFAVEGGLEVLRAVAEDVLVEAERLALGADEDVHHVGGQKPVACQMIFRA